jgi:hypothetical protein
MADSAPQQNNKAVAFKGRMEREMPAARQMAKRGRISPLQMKKLRSAHGAHARNRDGKL